MTAPVYLAFVVNGEEVTVETSALSPLGECVKDALLASKNEARPVSDWELRHESGIAIPPETHKLPVHSFSFEDDVCLFLTLRVGVGG